MTTIKKGDTSAEMSLVLAEGFDYAGKTVFVEYQGARRSFSGVVAGGSVAFSFTARETAAMSLGVYPVRVWIEGPDGVVTTAHNAKVRICVTDNPADVHGGGAIYLDVIGSLHDIEGLPARYTDEDLKAKVNEIVRRLGGTVAALLVCALPAFGAGVTVLTAPKGAVYNDQPVVTNIIADIPEVDMSAVTNIAQEAAQAAQERAVADAKANTTAATNALAEALTAAMPTDNAQLANGAGYVTKAVTNGLLAVETDPTVPAWAKAASAPLPPNYANVSNKAMNAATKADTMLADTFTEWICNPRRSPMSQKVLVVVWDDVANAWVLQNINGGMEGIEPAGTLNSTSLTFQVQMLGGTPTVTATRKRNPGYVLGSQTDKALAAEADLAEIALLATNYTDSAIAEIPAPDFSPSNATLVATIEETSPAPGDYATVSNRAMTALQSFTETDPTISSWAKAASKPTYTASDVGAYSATDGQNLEGIVNAWEGYWGGTNVVFEVTNYYGNTSGEFPRMRVKELRDGAWNVVWDENTKFDVCETNLMSNVVNYVTGYAAENFAPRAWGTVTDKGSPNPVTNTVWMTSPETYFAGGTEYQRVAVGSGSICVLVDNGALTHTAGEPGTFRFQDDGGTNYFGFAKSESYTIGCRTDGIQIDGTLVTLRYDVIMAGTDVPIIYWRLSLMDGEWVQLNNSDGTATPDAPYTVTWYTSGGSYYAAINCGMNASGFFKAETEVAGEVVFETNMKIRAGGGIECQNTSNGKSGVIRPTYNGSAVTWTWSEN